MKEELFALISAIVSAVSTIVIAVLSYRKPANFLAWINVTKCIETAAITCMGYFVVNAVKKLRENKYKRM